ncbi:MAG: hypothetical protein JO316_09965 [Abitibacteriaceae bacterium]|nr:hypothetical protein [Abditibacteriaceae bacterium]
MHEGEIALEGKVHTVDVGQKTLVLNVTAFILPNGKTSQLPTAKAKSVVLDAKTVLYVRGDNKRLLSLADLNDAQDDISALVIGKDLGSGKALPAREVAVWDRVENGKFSFKGATVTNGAQGNDAVPINPPLVGSPTDTASPPPTQIASNDPVNVNAISMPVHNVFPYGDFEDVDEKGIPTGWVFSDHQHIKLMEEDGNHFLRIISPPGADGKANGFIAAPIRFKMSPTWKTIRLYARMRAANLKLGSKPWETARLALLFEDAGGNRAGPYQPVIELKKDSDWVDQWEDLQVPQSAAYLSLSPETFAAGTIDYDNIQVEPNPAPVSRVILKDFPEGDFEHLDALGNPIGWRMNDSQHIKLIEEAGNHFLRLDNSPGPDGKWVPFLAAPCRFRLDPIWKKVRIKARMRVHDLKMGSRGYEDARLTPLFEDAKGHQAGPDTPVLDLKQDCDWVEKSVTLTVTPGSVYLTLSPEMLGCSGVADYDDIRLEVVG